MFRRKRKVINPDGGAVWDPALVASGTASCVRKALALGRPIVHLDPAARTVRVRWPQATLL
jgi:hypothetical protein